MNYRHTYHAGNFADVLKHVILIAITQSFLRKENPFCYLDTHAGAGHYDLSSQQAQKGKEFENGIMKILLQKNPPQLIKDYLRCVKEINTATLHRHREAANALGRGDPNLLNTHTGLLHPTKNVEFAMTDKQELRFYPGSPYFVKEFLRQNDHMILSELHPEEHVALKKFFRNDSHVAVHCQDAYQSLKAFLPPSMRRGFVLIDPPFEEPNEFTHLIKTLHDVIKRWETGTYAIWYPIKNRLAVNRWLNTLKEKIKRPFLIAELSIYPDDATLYLNGCGMIIINPPWQLDQSLQETLPWLWNTLSIDGQGKYTILGLTH